MQRMYSRPRRASFFAQDYLNNTCRITSFLSNHPGAIHPIIQNRPFLLSLSFCYALPRLHFSVRVKISRNNCTDSVRHQDQENETVFSVLFRFVSRSIVYLSILCLSCFVFLPYFFLAYVFLACVLLQLVLFQLVYSISRLCLCAFVFRNMFFKVCVSAIWLSRQFLLVSQLLQNRV